MAGSSVGAGRFRRGGLSRVGSVWTIAQDFAIMVSVLRCRALLGIAQLIMLGELAVNRALDNLQLPE